MEDIISTVLDIEHEAQKIVESAKTAAEDSDALASAEIEKVCADYKARMQQRIEKMQQQEQQFCAQQLEIIGKTAAKTEKQLDSLYVQNKDKWVETLFAQLFGETK